MATRAKVEMRDREWYDRHEAGESQASIAEDAGVSAPYVCKRIKAFKAKYRPDRSVQAQSSVLVLAERELRARQYQMLEQELDRIDWQKLSTISECLARLAVFFGSVPLPYINSEADGTWNYRARASNPFKRAHLLATARMVEIQREKGFAGDGVTWLQDLEGLLSQNQQ
jgi:hypothetical protein